MSVCGSGGTGDALHAVCQMVAALPSRTFAAAPFSRAVSWLSAITVQPVRGSVGFARPSRLIAIRN